MSYKMSVYSTVMKEPIMRCYFMYCKTQLITQSNICYKIVGENSKVSKIRQSL